MTKETKNILSTLLILVGMSATAQNITDALQYSMSDLKGTARFNSMSGAFGALGGDLSAIDINPAGSSVFSSGEFSFSFGSDKSKYESLFHNMQQNKKSSDFSLNQIGIVFSIPNYNPDAKWQKFTFAFNYSTPKNFNGKDISFAGNPTTNLGDYFEYYADGVAQQDLLLEEYESKKVISRSSLQDLYARMGRAGNRAFKLRNALLGHYVGLINPNIGRDKIFPTDSDDLANAILNETNYDSNVSFSTFQHFDVITEGEIGKYNFNFSTQYGSDVFLGLNLNSWPPPPA